MAKIDTRLDSFGINTSKIENSQWNQEIGEYEFFWDLNFWNDCQ